MVRETPPPDPADYKMEDSIRVGIDLSQLSYSLGSSDDMSSTLIYTLKGLTDSTTISEYGIFMANSSSPLNSKQVLITRSVLSEPIIIKKDEVKTFTVTIDWSKLSDSMVVA